MIDFIETKAQIEAEMLQQVDPALDKREGSLIQTAVAPGAWWLEGFLLKMAQWQANGNPDTAVGQALDWLTELRGVTRKPATAAVRQGTFDAVIPPGSTFKTINGADSVIFSSGSLISSGGGTYVYEMTCQQTGTIGNQYSGQILPITAIVGLTSATIGTIISVGTEEETDDALRARYYATFQAPAYGGNISEYRQAILAINGVGAVQVYPANFYNGGGTVLCSIIDSDFLPASASLVTAVQNEICPPYSGQNTPSPDGFGIAPIGAAVTVASGTSLTVDIEFDCTFAPGVQDGVGSYGDDIKAAIEEYFASIRKSWGDPLAAQTISYPVNVYLARVTYAILTVPQVVNVANLTLNGSAADLTLTEDKTVQQVPVVGTVTINEQ